jgi:hypothetical protein
VLSENHHSQLLSKVSIFFCFLFNYFAIEMYLKYTHNKYNIIGIILIEYDIRVMTFLIQLNINLLINNDRLDSRTIPFCYSE